jgi:hydroxypyruvate reductase
MTARMMRRVPAQRPEPRPALGALTGRSLLIDLYQAALSAVDGCAAMARAARTQTLADTAVIAIGKAAPAMLAGAREVLGAHCVRAFVVTLAAQTDAVPRMSSIDCHAGDHPLPGERSLAAGAALEAFVAGLPDDLRVWVLVSGGASSLVESLVPGATLHDLQHLNRWALAHDVPITVLNALRPHLSRLKGGGLAALLAPRAAFGFVLSDVPDDDPAVVGSGLVAHAATPPGPWPAELPLDLAQRLRALPTSRSASLPTFVIGSLSQALDAAAERARALGWRVARHPARIDGAAAEAGAALARAWRTSEAEVLIGGGETTVVLPSTPGVGGRCQQLALAAAEVLAGHDDLLLLAAGSDGIDGTSPDAGAIVDGGTVARARDGGFEAADCLRRADAGSCLEASGDLLQTGPSGTNVGDLVLAVRGRALGLPECTA